MADKKNTLKKMREKRFESLSPAQQKNVKGGYRYIPAQSNPIGMLDWGEVEIREEEAHSTSIAFADMMRTKRR